MTVELLGVLLLENEADLNWADATRNLTTLGHVDLGCVLVNMSLHLFAKNFVFRNTVLVGTHEAQKV